MTRPYGAPYADLYDLFYQEKPYATEAKWISSKLAPRATVLDLACGTGGHTVALASLGHRVTGIDISLEMLQQAERKARNRGLRIGLAVGDMTQPPVREASFDTVVCLFDSIGYAQTDEGIRAALGGIRRALRPGGRLIMEFWHRPAMLSGFDSVRVRRWPTASGRVVRISETDLLPDQNLARVTYSVFELRDDRTYSAFEETHINRYFAVAEMDNFVTEAGLTPAGWRDGFSDDQPTAETWHVVGLATAP